LSARPATGFSRDLVLELKAAATALKKPRAIVARMERRQAGVHTRRASRDLAKWIGKAGDAVKKARRLAPISCFLRDL